MTSRDFIFLLCVSLTIYSNVEAASRIDPLVETKVGLIRGLRASDGDYSMFLGIPYATVNASNPFGPSIPREEFEEVFEAYDDSAICPQIEEFNNTVTGTLDCLHLNIYVPNSATTKNPLPVLVWIYGGGFSIGFAGRYLYGPKFLVRHDILLVTINYRLGPYGFMCLNTPDIPGNQGLKDQLSALRWIKENIASFGGNTNKITIFGESAGGMSVDYHLFSEQETLFNNVIMQSGTSFLPGLTDEGNTEATLTLAAQLGFVTDDKEEAVSFLSKVETNLVVAAAAQINKRFLPCVENDFDGVEKFISEYTINLEVPKAKNMAILLGHNNDEWISGYANKRPEDYENIDVFRERLISEFNFDPELLTEFEKIVRHFYLGDENFSEDQKTNIIDFESDFMYITPAQRVIKKYIENGASNVFYYVFSYTGGRNFVKLKNNISFGGAAHADEIGYLFDISYMRDTPSTEDQLLIDRITTLWANFVKYSNPTPETNEVIPVIWEPVQQDILNYYDIDHELSVKTRPFNRRSAFWDLFYTTNKELQNKISRSFD